LGQVGEEMMKPWQAGRQAPKAYVLDVLARWLCPGGVPQKKLG